VECFPKFRWKESQTHSYTQTFSLVQLLGLCDECELTMLMYRSGYQPTCPVKRCHRDSSGSALRAMYNRAAAFSDLSEVVPFYEIVLATYFSQKTRLVTGSRRWAGLPQINSADEPQIIVWITTVLANSVYFRTELLSILFYMLLSADLHVVSVYLLQLRLQLNILCCETQIVH